MQYAWGPSEVHTNRGPETLEGWYHLRDLGLNDTAILNAFYENIMRGYGME
jgi:hypothetical protein